MICSLTHYAEIASIIGVLIALISLWFIWLSVEKQTQTIMKETNIAKANTLISLRESFHKHLDIHKKIWNEDYTETIPLEDLVDVMSYLGQLEVLLPLKQKYGLLDDEDLENQYGFRISILRQNNAIIQHINTNNESYKYLIQLLERF